MVLGPAAQRCSGKGNERRTETRRARSARQVRFAQAVTAAAGPIPLQQTEKCEKSKTEKAEPEKGRPRKKVTPRGRRGQEPVAKPEPIKESPKEHFPAPLAKPYSSSDLGLPSLTLDTGGSFWSRLPIAGKAGVGLADRSRHRRNYFRDVPGQFRNRRQQARRMWWRLDRR